MEGRLRANMLWDSIVRYKTERGALGSKTGYPRLAMWMNSWTNPVMAWGGSARRRSGGGRCGGWGLCVAAVAG
jgi:hypothetical protein